MYMYTTTANAVYPLLIIRQTFSDGQQALVDEGTCRVAIEPNSTVLDGGQNVGLVVPHHL